MCGRYSIVRGDRIVQIIPNVTMPANLRLVGRYNAAPTQDLPVVAGQSLQVQMFKWGLIPFWAKDATIGSKMINARAETLREKPAFRKSLERRRCLIPADGFYEWRKNANGTKTPMYIRMRDGDLFAFAGLWDIWKNPAGEEVRSFTIITTTPNELMRTIHNRMPAILPREAYSHWLNEGTISEAQTAEWLKPYPAKAMAAYAVSPLVNSPRNDSEELIKEVADAAPEEEKKEPQQQRGLFD